MKNSNYIGLILAAGRGSRLKNLTNNKPKSFLTINKKKLSCIQRQKIQVSYWS